MRWSKFGGHRQHRHRLASRDLVGCKIPRVASEWHPEKNGDVTPHVVEPDHMMSVWWKCSKGHEFQQSVRRRTSGRGRCPHCLASTWG
ncbi:MAG: zinc-ribbon domain-containing protein [Myxococcales bacterium]|nr:zinc-ribbon domain-containing protein [Myxococcales bacterium]